MDGNVKLMALRSLLTRETICYQARTPLRSKIETSYNAAVSRGSVFSHTLDPVTSSWLTTLTVSKDEDELAHHGVIAAAVTVAAALRARAMRTIRALEIHLTTHTDLLDLEWVVVVVVEEHIVAIAVTVMAPLVVVVVPVKALLEGVAARAHTTTDLRVEPTVKDWALTILIMAIRTFSEVKALVWAMRTIQECSHNSTQQHQASFRQPVARISSPTMGLAEECRKVELYRLRSYVSQTPPFNILTLMVQLLCSRNNSLPG
jgi:hypothetical protein